ncbi:MAG: T9SS type A sorting domain-containing protein [Flavobacteriales bacterium]|nr:T9SS type A sorting domain-containing protein [Flavobacteriales bacterium]MBK9289221.1 T9SS type A sorting domain-containing protein [Flavobacteriales bacterium]MBL0036726.1 T9SS type A sorting domain-containing protein [Flavobacteriales bacterium]
MRLLAPLLFVLLAPSVHAQYTIDWSHPAADTYKNGVMAARDTSDNVVVVGTRSSFVGAAHIYTHKYDKDGLLLWEQVDSTGVAWMWEQPTWVLATSTNDVYVTGYMYTGTSDIYPDSVVALKYDAQGNLQWRRTLGPTFLFGVYVRCAVDANDNLYVGVAGLNPGGFHLIKYDPSGNEVFHTMEANAIATNMTSMRLKGDRIALVGTGIGAVHGAVAVWDTAGSFLWSHLVTGYGAQDVEVDDALNTYVLTSYPDLVAPLSGRDVVIKKFDAAGDSSTQFAHDFSGTEQPARMTLVNGHLTVIGWTVPQGGGYMNWTTFRTDLNGALQWNATYNAMLSNDEIPGWVAAKDNGDVYVTGKGGPLYQGQYQQFVTLKYSNGVQQWAHTDPYYGYNGVACVLGKDSALYVLGQGSMTVTRYIDQLSTGGATMALRTGLHLYPSPADQQLTVSSTAPFAGPEPYTVLDVTGRVLLSGVFRSATPVLNVSGFPNGTYILRTHTGIALPFVVQH